jgi:hypothetical protein
MTGERTKETERFSHRCLVLFSTPRSPFLPFAHLLDRSVYGPENVRDGDSHSDINCIVYAELPKCQMLIPF